MAWHGVVAWFGIWRRMRGMLACGFGRQGRGAAWVAASNAARLSGSWVRTMQQMCRLQQPVGLYWTTGPGHALSKSADSSQQVRSCVCATPAGYRRVCASLNMNGRVGVLHYNRKCGVPQSCICCSCCSCYRGADPRLGAQHDRNDAQRNTIRRNPELMLSYGTWCSSACSVLVSLTRSGMCVRYQIARLDGRERDKNKVVLPCLLVLPRSCPAATLCTPALVAHGTVGRRRTAASLTPPQAPLSTANLPPVLAFPTAHPQLLLLRVHISPHSLDLYLARRCGRVRLRPAYHLRAPLRKIT